MFKSNKSLEEEKVENIEKIRHFENSAKNSNYNTKEYLNIKDEPKVIKNLSCRSLSNKKENLNLNKAPININPNKILPNNLSKNNNDNNEFKTINISNKIDINENKINNNNKYPKLVTLNKDELYNAFVFFQNIISKEDNENLNNVEYIKNKLFEFVSMRKNNIFTETIEINDNFDLNENDVENNFDIQNYMPIYYKSERDLNINFINNTNINENNNINLVKSYSFSYSINSKNKILNNQLFSLYNNAKDTIKSNSQIFNEYLLIDSKLKDKTLSVENSKSFHHNYSFDIKNTEKNEFSYHSIQDNKNVDNNINDKEKNLEIDNNEIIKYYNKYNFENFNKKELDHKSPFDNKGYKERILGKNFGKYTTEDELITEPIDQKNNKLKIIDDNYVDNDESNINKYLNKKSSINEKIIISPVKPDNLINKYGNSENKKYKDKNIQSQQQENILHEIKVNKNKNLNNKEQLIGEKIKELNDEIKKFKEERNKVTLLKEEYEKLQAKLIKDIREFNMKKEIQKKNYKGENDKFKVISQIETKLIMSITQHNQSLILNNNKKSETIELLKQRIYELENIIKSKNNYDNSKNYTKINNNIKKKKINENSKINLKKNIGYNSSEKAKRSKHNIVNQTINENILNKNFFDNNINKKFIMKNI